MKAKKERTKLQIAKLQGYLDGRISRYVRCQWSDQILENFSQAIGGEWCDLHWDDDCRIIYIQAMHTTGGVGRIDCDIEALMRRPK